MRAYLIQVEFLNCLGRGGDYWEREEHAKHVAIVVAVNGCGLAYELKSHMFPLPPSSPRCTAEVIATRAAKEAVAVATWHRDTAHMRTLTELHAWLFDTHLCYSVSRQGEFGKTAVEMDPKLAATY
jgi:hypothetical protein